MSSLALAAEMTDEVHALNEATSEAIVTVNDVGLVVGWNSGAGEILRRTADETLGQQFLDLVPQAHREQFRESSTQFRSDGAFIWDALRRDGEVFPIEMSVSSWTTHGEHGRTAFNRDITDRVADETEIK